MNTGSPFMVVITWADTIAEARTAERARIFACLGMVGGSPLNPVDC